MMDTLICTLAAIGSLAVSCALLAVLIPRLRALGVGQHILKIGPSWHLAKEGTPTMGGIAFAVSVTVVFSVILAIYRVFAADGGLNFGGDGDVRAVAALGYALLCGACGSADDLAKLMKKQNAGLKAWQKFVLLLLCGCAYLFVMHRVCGLGTVVRVPLIGAYVDMGVWFWVLSAVLLTGTVNAVNLTDGVDGLCGSVSAVASLYYIACSLSVGGGALAVLGCAMLGGCGGFLVYNLPPARVFMGDTGSLFLGALLCGLAFGAEVPFSLFSVGIVFMLEALSVMMQVGIYKLTGKRVFKMAPFHHHLERCGWSERRITAVFAVFTGAIVLALILLGM